jgi:uncharacterized iron-regulated membrane protein
MRLPLRNLVFWLHLAAAVVAGTVVLLMAATGLALSFEAQIQAWADRPDSRLRQVAGGPPPSLEEALGRVAAGHPELVVSAVTVRRDPREAVLLSLGRDGVLFVDPRAGEVLGPGAAGVRRTLRAITDLHRFLGASGEGRERGKAATGAANLAFLVVLISGLYLWVPRAWRRVHVRNALWFRRALAGKERDFNWHHVFGIWALVPLVVIVGSAVPISYRWAGDLLLRVTGSAPAGSGSAAGAQGARGSRESARATPPAGADRGAPPALSAMELAGLDAALARARAEVPRWRSLTVRLPLREAGWAITVDRSGRRGRPDLRDQLVVDALGSLAEHEPFAAQSLGRRTRSWMRWLHTGEAGGVPGQAVAAVACLATLLLGWTGYALAWRRLVAWRRRRSFATAGIPNPSHSALVTQSVPTPPEG